MIRNLVFSDNIYYQLSRHILYWIVIYSYLSIIPGVYYWNLEYYLKLNFIYIPIDITFTYFIIYYILHVILKKQNYVSGIAIFIITLTGLFVIVRLIQTSIEPHVLNENYKPTNLYKTFYEGLSIYTVILSPAIFIKTFKYWHNSSITIHELKNNTLELKIQSLQNQLNPHLFFNSLNNLYALSLKQSDKVSNYILQLADIFRYVLTAKSNVSILEELKIVNAYIELELLRYARNIRINILNTLDSEVQKTILIPPLTFLTLVENAFKHGINQSNKDGWIEIELFKSKTELHFMISNSISKKKNLKPESLGIGLSNIKKRLELSYNSRYKIHTTKNISSFSLLLKLKLDSYENKLFDC